LIITNTIDFKEFKAIYDIIGKKITELDFKSNILSKYCSANEGITLQGFKDWFL
jgi:hypothetical protein